MAVDAQGNVHATGGYGGRVDFDPGPGTAYLTSVAGAGGDVFVLKLDAGGNFLWARSMGGPSPDTGCLALGPTEASS